jgi:hypothetical protein
MSKIRKSIVILVVLGLAAAAEARPATSSAATRPTTRSSAIEPPAMKALEKMGKYLREQKSFTVRAWMDTDQVLESGQKVRLASTGVLRVRRPDHLRADVRSDRKQRQFFFDGKTFTLNGQRVGYYASVPAPPTIRDLARVLEARFGIQLPLVDLFYWGTNLDSSEQITSAIYVGPARLGTAETDHYAFRQPGLDWQIWIEDGEVPVPRKLILTATDDPSRPEYIVELAWELGVEHADSVFAFVPPKGSHEIKLVELPSTR